MEDRFDIHLFTPENPADDEVKLINEFLNAGLDVLHLRRPGYDRNHFEAILDSIPLRHQHKIYLHDHYDLAEKYGCGIQFNSRNELIESSFKNVPISKSCHSLKETEENRHLSFTTLSPIFNSISKQGYMSNFSIETLSKKDLSRVIALGGITLKNIKEVKAAGFRGSALLGDIWTTPNGVDKFLKYLRLRNISLQFITNGRDVEETVRQAEIVLSAGCRWIQVRMKETDEEEIKEALIRLLPKCQEAGATLIVDDHYKLSNYCHGVHLGQNDISIREAREEITPEKIIGLTVNTPDQIISSRIDPPDYYGVGPYRFTSTKKNLSPILGLDGYKQLSALIDREWVAIGGIRPNDIPAILKTGAAGIAVSSIITQSENPYKQTKQLIDILNGK
ncbi:MAG: thiamine phosphate synthase [Muribaculaceae bacterium]|nr:thiamine phosphate synthase [Muribaculaceae bacterium]